jgi:hypothetical protein
VWDCVRSSGTTIPAKRPSRSPADLSHPTRNAVSEERASAAAWVTLAVVAIGGYGNFHPPRDERLDAYRQLADMATSGRTIALARERQRTGAHCTQILIPS